VVISSQGSEERSQKSGTDRRAAPRFPRVRPHQRAGPGV